MIMKWCLVLVLIGTWMLCHAEEPFKFKAAAKITKVALDMQKTGQLKTPPAKLKAKFADMTVKAQTMEKKVQQQKDARDGKLGKITEGIDAVSGGIETLITGIQSGNWQDMILGGLDIVTQLVSMAGPVGAMLGTVLSLVSTLFGIFGGSTGETESQEDMFKRVIDEALARSRADNLRADGEAVKRTYESIQSSIQQYRDANKITKGEAEEIYNQAFTGLAIFGKLKFQINKICAIEKADSKSDEKAGKCLEFINLYCDLSILRQMLIAEMSSLVASVDLVSTAENLLHLIEKEQANDKQIVKFISDPVNHKDRRYVVNYFYGSPEKWPTIKAYMHTLDKKHDFIQENVMMCSENRLMGSCHKLEAGAFLKKDLHGWSGKMKSIYIAASIKVTGYRKDNFRGTYFGPFHGPTVIGTLPRPSKDTAVSKWVSMKVKESTEDAGKMLRICEEKNLNQNGRCDLLAPGYYANLHRVSDSPIMTSPDYGTAANEECKFPFTYDGNTYNECTDVDESDGTWCSTESNYYPNEKWGVCIFERDWQQKILSVSIPSGYVLHTYTGYRKGGFKRGPFYGPNAINDFCGGKEVKSATLEKVATSAGSMVKICRVKDFGGFCDYLETKDRPNMIIHGCYWNNDKSKVKSLTVPGGLRVHLFTEENYGGMALGPYDGPATMGSVDGGDMKDGQEQSVFIKSMKIESMV